MGWVHIHDVFRLSMRSIDVKEASDDLEELMDLAGRGETFEIVAGGRRAVLMSASEHSGIMETCIFCLTRRWPPI